MPRNWVIWPTVSMSSDMEAGAIAVRCAWIAPRSLAAEVRWNRTKYDLYLKRSVLAKATLIKIYVRITDNIQHIHWGVYRTRALPIGFHQSGKVLGCEFAGQITYKLVPAWNGHPGHYALVNLLLMLHRLPLENSDLEIIVGVSRTHLELKQQGECRVYLSVQHEAACRTIWLMFRARKATEFGQRVGCNIHESLKFIRIVHGEIHCCSRCGSLQGTYTFNL